MGGGGGGATKTLQCKYQTYDERNKELLTQTKFHLVLLKTEGRFVTWYTAGRQADTHGAWGRGRGREGKEGGEGGRGRREGKEGGQSYCIRVRCVIRY